jgi:hypothetical protein
MQPPRDDLNVLLFPMEHTLFCLSIDKMRLHTYPHFWHDTVSAPQSAEPRVSSPWVPLFTSSL